MLSSSATWTPTWFFTEPAAGVDQRAVGLAGDGRGRGTRRNRHSQQEAPAAAPTSSFVRSWSSGIRSGRGSGRPRPSRSGPRTTSGVSLALRSGGRARGRREGGDDRVRVARGEVVGHRQRERALGEVVGAGQAAGARHRGEGRHPVQRHARSRSAPRSRDGARSRALPRGTRGTGRGRARTARPLPRSPPGGRSRAPRALPASAHARARRRASTSS